MKTIIENSERHLLKNLKIFQFKKFSCVACSQSKLIIKPSLDKVGTKSLTFLEHIQGDICRPIHYSCTPFKYFIILINASSRWSYICLLSTHNLMFARLLAQIIQLRA